jgi:FlaA1/EpsC-like NDP-sugar epimerase
LIRRYGAALLLDVLVVVGSYYAAALLRIGYGPDFMGNAAQVRTYLSGLTAYMPFVVLTYLLVNGFLQLYGRVWQYASALEGMSIAVASLVSTAGLLITDVLFGATRPIPISVILVGGLLSMLGFVVLRYHRQLWFSITDWATLFPKPEARASAGDVPSGGPQPYDAERGEYGQVRKRRALIVGAQQSGQLLAAYMSRHSQAYLPVGFVDQDSSHRGLRVRGLKVLGDWQSIPELVSKQNVDLVVVALSDANLKTKTELMDHCLASKAEIKVLPNVYQDVLRGAAHGALRGFSPNVDQDVLRGQAPEFMAEASI